MTTQEGRDFYTVPEVARMLRLDRRSIWRAIASGVLGSNGFGRARRISDHDLKKYLRNTRGIERLTKHAAKRKKE